MENRQVNAMKELEEAFDPQYTLPQVYENVIRVGIDALKRDKQIMAAAFLIMKDFKTNEYKVAIYPMIMQKPEDSAIHGKILRKIVKEMKESSTPDFQMVGMIRVGLGHMKIYDSKDVLRKDGSVDPSKVIAPREDKDATDVILFDLEEPFIKTTRMYEYIRSGDNIVVNPEPVVNNKNPYDVREDANSHFGFFFTEGQSAVN